MCSKSSLLKFSFKQTKWIFLLSFVFSIVLCIVFEISYQTNLTKDEQNIVVSIYDEDHSSYSEGLVEYLESSLDATIVSGNQEKMENQVITYRALAGITIPKGFGIGVQEGTGKNSPVIMKFVNNDISTLVTMTVEQYISQAKGGPSLTNKLLNTKTSDKDNHDYATKKALVTVMGIFPQALMIIAICLAIFLVNEKQEGNLMRIYISPVSFLEYLLGRGGIALLASIVPGIIVFALAILRQREMTEYLFGTLFNIILFTMIMDLIAFYLGLRCTTQNTIFLSIVGFTSIGSIVGGCFFDVSNSISIIKWPAKIFPHYWLMRGNRELLNNATIEVFYQGLCVLVLYLIVTIVLNYVAYRKLDKNGGKIK